MALRPVEPTTLPDQVFGQLLGEIVSGRYGPGSTLPSERTLTLTFAVNRHVVREALGRLEQVGLVRTIHGGGTWVQDISRSAGLDLLALVAEHAETVEVALPLMRAGLEMRAGIGQDVARLCAERAGATAGPELLRTAEQLAAIRAGADLLPVDERFWQLVLDGADNLAYQLAFNSLIRAVQAIPQFSIGWLEHELGRSDFRRPIAVAIAAGDGETATKVVRESLTPPAELAIRQPPGPEATAEDVGR